jgi:NAD(P)-dependent dehydrogenase (short-subunit alcohol dehydrogenase family)
MRFVILTAQEWESKMTSASKNALVFGVGPRSGIGAEICHQAAAKGFHVFVNGRTEEKIVAVADDINANGGQATPLLADVTDEHAIQNAMIQVAADERPLELAIYNAGNNRPEAFLDVTPEIFEQMWKVICFGGFLTAQATLRLMAEQKDRAERQSLLFTGASGSMRGKSNFAAFAAGKGALRMMVQSIAREFGPQGVHVAHVVIDGAVNGDKLRKNFAGYLEKLGDEGSLEVAAIAQTFFMLHDQPRTAWTQEIDLRPFKETF